MEVVVMPGMKLASYVIIKSLSEIPEIPWKMRHFHRLADRLRAEPYPGSVLFHFQ
jgi:hypothetical protein